MNADVPADAGDRFSTGWGRVLSTAQRCISRGFLPLCTACAVVHAVGLLLLSRLAGSSDSPDRALLAQLACWLLAGGLWFAAMLSLALRVKGKLGLVGSLSRRALQCVLGLGLGMRLAALPLPVTHSQDVYRYVWDGAVQRAGENPYLDPPSGARYQAVRQEQPDAFARINHRHLPTIYPPTAQLALRLSAQLGATGEPLQLALLRWRVVCGATELCLLVVLAALLRRRRVDLSWLSLWLICPLPVIEIWLNAHLDGLGILALAAALWAWPDREIVPQGPGRSGRFDRSGHSEHSDHSNRPEHSDHSGPSDPLAAEPGMSRSSTNSTWCAYVRAALGGATVALAILVKPLAAVVLPGLRGVSRRSLLVFCVAGGLAAFLTWLPYRQAGLQVTPSLGEYGRRWRSNDGAFAVLQATSEGLTALAYRPPYWEPWRSQRLARLVTGRDRATVWPDELAGFLARVLAALPLLWVLRRCWMQKRLPHQTALLLLSGYALLTPVLHPWYLLWPLLLAPLWIPLAWPLLVLCALSPLAYLPLVDELRGLPHREDIVPRLIEHGAAWLAVAWVWPRIRQGRGASESEAAAGGATTGGAFGAP